MRTNRRQFLTHLTAGLGGALVALRSPAQAQTPAPLRPVVLGRPILGTLVESEANHPEIDVAREAIHAGFARIDDVDRLMSVFRSESDVSRLGARAGAESLVVDDETYRVLTAAREIARESRGALDVTIHPLVQLWTRAGERGELPSRGDLDRTARLVGIGGLVLDARDRSARLVEAGAGVDLGGIAKGYAVDAAVDALVARGIRSGLVNAGGDLRALGRNRDGGVWQVGLRNPLRPSALLLALAVGDEGVATSGNYFRYWEIGGRQYGHVLDPRTGRPAATALSATVVASSAVRADGLATAALVSGVPGALDLVERAAVDGIVVAEQRGRPGTLVVHVTRGLAGRVRLLDPTAVLAS